MDALVARNWGTVFSFESTEERQELGWDQARFAKFCDALAKTGWPVGLRPKVDEVLPIVNKLKPGEIGSDDSWNRAGTREYAVTLYRGPVSQQVFSVQFRHGLNGEWHPDVISTLIHITKGDRARGANPQLELLEAMHAANCSELTIYPDGDHTDLHQLSAYLAGETKTWIEPGVEPLR